MASLSPRNHATAISTPASQRRSPVTVAARMHASARAATSIGCWSKAGRGSPRLQPPAGTHRQAAVSGLDGQQPVEHAQAVAQNPAAAEFGAGHDDSLGDGRVRVAEPGCWPRPPGVSRRFSDDRAGPVEKRARASMVRPFLEYLGGPERRERHGVRPRRRDLRAAAESVDGFLADPRGGSSGGGGAKAPQSAAPAVPDGGLALPAAVVTEAVTEPSVWRLCLRQEVEVAAPQGYQFLGWRRFPAHHDQAAGNVIDAVAALVLGHDSLGVLEQADVVGQPLQVPERRSRPGNRVVWQIFMSGPRLG